MMLPGLGACRNGGVSWARLQRYRVSILYLWIPVCGVRPGIVSGLLPPHGESMYVEDPPPDHRRIRRVRRRRLAVGTTLAVALAFLGFSPLPSAASGAGAGPLPVQFKLTDNNGAWYD